MFILYNQQSPHLRPGPTDKLIPDSDQPDQRGVKRIKLFILNLVLINTGKTIARNAQPLITNVGTLKDGRWQTDDNWLPLSLLWIFDEPAQQAAGKATEEKDLVPGRPYIFNLGELSTEDPRRFSLTPIIAATNQTIFYYRGEFCFEITAFALGTQPCRKYIRIQWGGGTTKDYNEVKSKIKVFMEDNPPW